VDYCCWSVSEPHIHTSSISLRERQAGESGDTLALFSAFTRLSITVSSTIADDGITGLLFSTTTAILLRVFKFDEAAFILIYYSATVGILVVGMNIVLRLNKSRFRISQLGLAMPAWVGGFGYSVDRMNS
jgi:hypothetical protein